ncbi:MupA/Atu3671 family FMN-dependent luciferase-like monooxygenase [Streptomyces sp. NPDC006012]|uniref:MupA/Atu3671 family FMN-dependent luciferase-like monooxygenase n=1 Tax=Streptomyces sp. NPDC006012 TaxID=3364739 RepID=UPI0036BC3378
MDFSLLYFANRTVDDATAEYDLLFEAARFADENSFTAVWLPERHFHPFGGSYPNPALAAAALAARTRNVRLRAGSVVLPLHDPLNVVEDWAFVDNISQGRVDLALATGWNADDFVLAPDRYADRRAYTTQQVPVLRELWAGKSVTRRNGDGADVEVATYPRPVQPDLNLWLTCSSNPASFEQAGALGLNVLTALLFLNVEELAPRIAAYRAARERHGHDPATGQVTAMVHTFVGASDNAVRDVVRAPFLAYLESSVDLWKNYWPDLAKYQGVKLLEYAFERYFRTSALLGSVDKCTAFADALAAAGVDEVASLIDFGAPDRATLDALPYLDQVRRACRPD